MVDHPASDHPQPPARHAALIADDDPIVRSVLRSILTQAHYTVVCAASGHEALSHARGLDASVAILDLAMPGGDGIETCAALRQLPNWRDVPLVMLTTYHSDKALAAARQAGATAFLCKPFVPSQLLRRIADLTGDAAAAQSSEPVVWRAAASDAGPPGIWSANLTDPPEPLVWRQEPAGHAPTPSADPAAAMANLRPPAATPARHATQRALPPVHRHAAPETPPPRDDLMETTPRRRILIADDDELTREVVSHILSREGYMTHCASNGQEALAAIAGNEFDLILMDIRMPGVNGTQATRLIRALPGDRFQGAIIAMTSTGYEIFTRELIAAGMNGYLTKPVRSDSLLACVRQYLPRRGLAEPPPVLRADRLDRVAKALPAGGMCRLLDGLADQLNDILPCIAGWGDMAPAEFQRRLHRLAETSATLGCAALLDETATIEAMAAPTDAIKQHFVETAHATLAAIAPYRGRDRQPV